ncbi:hypothetical protein [Bradyrhizobium sp.]|uniref:hypothetical protein n=1 Tax=Bradyrhizobium sp. TaxID=376 RepID=UPI0025B82EBD|nr:hypothetical protein [Bradyrhizobium sp.]
MQPLSRVKPDALVNWGDSTTMAQRPQLAAKICHCITQWSEIEIFLGAFLGVLLHTNHQAAVAMYSGVESRAAQLRLITSAAKASVPPEHFDVFSVFLSAVVRPLMKERDKLAHWSWGYSPDLPDSLLLSDPSHTLENFMLALRTQPGVENAAVPTNFDRVFVVGDSFLDGISKRAATTKTHLRVAMASVWDHNSPKEHAEYLLRLSNVPQVREGLDRLAQGRQKTQEAPPQAPR